MTNIDKLEQEQKELQEKVEQIGKTIAEMKKEEELCFKELEQGEFFVLRGEPCYMVRIKDDEGGAVQLHSGLRQNFSACSRTPVIVTDRNGKPL